VAVPASTPTVPGSPVRPPRLRSPLARAVVPVLGGIAFLALLFLGTWLVAVFISRGGAETTERLAPPTFEVGSAERFAESIAEDGPIIFPGLETVRGERTLVLHHVGDDPFQGWRLYWAYPADRDASCHVAQIEGTARFVDCEDRELDVTELARPTERIFVQIEDERVVIDLRAAVETGD
jgi:hypothetical protein